MSVEQWSLILNFLIALYAAGLSTYLGIRELRKDKRQVHIRCRPGALQPAFGPARPVLTVTGINSGHRPVELVAAGFYLSDQSSLALIQDITGNFPLPRVLQDGESVSINADLLRLETDLDELRKSSRLNTVLTSAFMRDSGGKEYISELPQLLRDKGLAKQLFWGKRFWRKFLSLPKG